MHHLVPMPPMASVADFAQAMAGGAGRAAQLFKNTSAPTNTAPVTPAGLTAPSSAIVAVFVLTPVVTGRFLFDYNLTYTDSAADTVLASVSIFHGVSSVTGGTVVGGPPPAAEFIWESGAMALVGGSAVGVPATYTATFATGNLTQTLNLSGLALSFTDTWLVLEISATHNLSAMNLSASCFEV